MPHSAPRPCPWAGCTKLIGRRDRYCREHNRAAEARKPQRMRGRKLQERNERLARANPLCVRCRAKGIVRAATEWDHIVPLEQGGADDESNLQGLCATCHAEKTAEERRERSAY